jgi:NFU1 iron-sulfur cluster scaffold homolog, mitochondrial
MGDMGYRVKQFQETPNPNAVKCVLDRRIAERPRSYFRAEDAAGDDVGSRLFAIGRITNILISADWVTVSKRPEAAWGPIRKAVEQVLGGVE